MCQLLSYYHTISPLSVLYPTPGCWSQESKPHSCLVSSLQVGLCQQGTPGNLGSWWREKGLGSFSKVHVDFLILSGSPLSHFTLAEAIESDRNSQIQFAVSLNWQVTALSNRWTHQHEARSTHSSEVWIPGTPGLSSKLPNFNNPPSSLFFPNSEARSGFLQLLLTWFLGICSSFQLFSIELTMIYIKFSLLKITNGVSIP